MSNLCQVHKQEWKQSHYSEDNCEICILKKQLEKEIRSNKKIRKYKSEIEFETKLLKEINELKHQLKSYKKENYNLKNPPVKKKIFVFSDEFGNFRFLNHFELPTVRFKRELQIEEMLNENLFKDKNSFNEEGDL